jgi:hypothetical protein
MAAPFLTLRIPEASANPLVAASSVAPAASGYERPLRPSDARFSTSLNAACSEGGL